MTKNNNRPLAANIAELRESCSRFMAMENGTNDEYNFFRGRIENTRDFVVISDMEGEYIFLPGAYVAYNAKTLDGWKSLVGGSYGTLGKARLDQLLDKITIGTGSPSNQYVSLCEKFLTFCASQQRRFKPCNGLNPLEITHHPLIFWLLPEATNQIDLTIYEPTDNPDVLDERARKIMAQPILDIPQGNPKPERSANPTFPFKRLPEVVAWVLKEAKGKCESSGFPAPFIKDDGYPYLEVHHVHHLADGGSDTVSNAVALCPNCHRRLHYSKDRENAREGLYKKLTRLKRE